MTSRLKRQHRRSVDVNNGVKSLNAHKRRIKILGFPKALLTTCSVKSPYSYLLQEAYQCYWVFQNRDQPILNPQDVSICCRTRHYTVYNGISDMIWAALVLLVSDFFCLHKWTSYEGPRYSRSVDKSILETYEWLIDVWELMVCRYCAYV